MQKTIRAGVAKAGLAVLLLCFASGSAFADLTYTGSTTGQFYLGSSPQGISVQGLTFTGTSFGPTSGPTATLGTFSLNTLLSYFDPYDFKLTVNFTEPAVSGTVYTADVSGFVTLLGGSATINFTNNGPVHFGSGDTGFYLSLNDLTVRNGSSAKITGTLSANPEPASIVLTSALLGGVIVFFRKRLRSC